MPTPMTARTGFGAVVVPAYPCLLYTSLGAFVGPAAGCRDLVQPSGNIAGPAEGPGTPRDQRPDPLPGGLDPGARDRHGVGAPHFPRGGGPAGTAPSKEVKTSDPVQIGSYRGFTMLVEFEAWKQEYTPADWV